MHEYVVIIGRPNVGKSTLYNRLIGKRKALVHHVPGTTRDRSETDVCWNGYGFLLADTGGWEETTSFISAAVRRQMETALAKADLVLFVVDGKNGYHPLDGEIASILRRQQKKVLVVVNKIDSPKEEPKANDFYQLGFDDMISISGTHGLNISELLEKVCSYLTVSDGTEQVREEAVRIVLVGKPNVGKSSLLNCLSKEERTIVHEKPGTTREAVDIALTRDGRRFLLIDTPGLHRRHKFNDDLEYLAALSTQHALERSDVAVLVMDIEQGIGETEARIAEQILENHRGCLIAVNKWDLPENREEAVKFIQGQLEQKLPFLWWAKVIYTSAKTGQRAEKILTEVQEIYGEYSKFVPEDELNDVIRNAVRNKPLSRRGEILRIKHVKQTGVRAPYFVFTVNRTDLVHFSYRRYLENVIRERFGFTGTPLVLRFQKTPSTSKNEKE